jgi:hypothetical protein
MEPPRVSQVPSALVSLDLVSTEADDLFQTRSQSLMDGMQEDGQPKITPHRG